ncbi:MAG: hypothetical protein HDS79_04255 [Bacteroidales bacterium]|nr:hypothetical protein [Bacteroidales bacterium]
MKRNVLYSLGIMLSLSAYAAEPTPPFEGRGLASKPYLIQSVEDLMWLHNACNNPTTANRGHYSRKFFKLTTDLDMAGIENFYGIATAIPGNTSGATYNFAGIFDGDGHTIKNLTIKGVTFETDGKAQTSGAKKSRDYVGLFGYLENGAVVKNIIIDSSCHFEGYNYVGGIAGCNSSGAQILNCHNGASIDAYGDYAGGIIGRIITSSAVTQTITEIEGCSNTGRIRVETSHVGGIVGNISFGKISNCANAGSIEAESFNALKPSGKGNNAGGIAGHVEGVFITDCLNAGTVKASASECGGIVGELKYKDGLDAVVSNCLSYGSVICPNSGLRGNIVGMNGSAGVGKEPVSNCVFDGQLMSTTTVGSGAGGGCDTGFVPMTTRDLISGNAISGFGDNWSYAAGYYPTLKIASSDIFKVASASYFLLPEGVEANSFVGSAPLSSTASGLVASTSSSSWLSTTPTAVVSIKTDECQMDTVFLSSPLFSKVVPVCQVQIPFKGNGSASDPYQLSSLDDFKNLAALVIAKYPVRFERKNFIVTQDVDFQNDSTFIGIGTIKMTNAYKNHWFAGSVDGDNHTLSNIQFKNASSITGCGFFGTLGGNARIQNLTLDSTCYIEGNQRVGGIAGFLHEGVSISNCHVAGSVYGFSTNNTEVGGIAGYVSAERNSPGNTMIENCSFTGTLLANRDCAAGIAGTNRGYVKGCVNTGRVRAYAINDGKPLTNLENYNRVGGIAGYHLGTVENCANYGNVEGGKNVGGIAGQSANSYGSGIVKGSLNVAPVVNFANGTFTGAIAGAAPEQTDSTATLFSNVYDYQLSGVGAVSDSIASGCSQFTTIALTKHSVSSDGQPSEILSKEYSYTEGQYPVPSSVASFSRVKSAAGIYMILPDTMTIRTLEPGIEIPFSNVADLKYELSSKEGFEIKDSMLVVLEAKDSVSNLLTLTTPLAWRSYPITNIATEGYVGIEEISATDEEISAEYYTLDGLRTNAARCGEILIRIATMASGRKEVTKVQLR